jgi:hemerythrin-like domain-containing protein
VPVGIVVAVSPDGAVPDPLDLILVAHEAFRRDLAEIDRAARAAAHGDHDLDAVIDRHQFYGEMLAWHAHGEDTGIFPALAPAAPHIVAAYELDHRGLDVVIDGLDAAVTSGDAIDIARATAACKYHLDMHLYKEDVDLYPTFAEVLAPDAQAAAVQVFTDALPVDRFGDFVRWLFPLVDPVDQERVIRVWHSAMPTSVFRDCLRIVEDALGDRYAALAARLTEMPDA